MSFGHFIVESGGKYHKPTNQNYSGAFIEINAWPVPYQLGYQHETQSSADKGRGMIAGMILKILIFLSYTSDKLFYEANTKNEILKWLYMEA